MTRKKLLYFLFIFTQILSTNSFAQSLDEKTEINLVHLLNKKFEKIKLSSAQLRTVGQYSAMYYQPINYGLRQKDLNSLKIMSPQICQLDAIISKKSIPVGSIVVYRGQSFLPEGGDQKGFQFISRSFASSSLSKNIAARFIHGDSGFLDVITLPTNKIPSFWVAPISLVKEENELLLPRNLKFEVVDIQTEILPSDSGPKETLVRKLQIIGIEKDPQIEEVLGCPRH